MSNYHSANKPPFGPLAAIIHRREPNDIQYIEKMRTTLRWWDRCRWFGLALYGSLLAALIWLCHKFEPFNTQCVVFLRPCQGSAAKDC